MVRGEWRHSGGEGPTALHVMSQYHLASFTSHIHCPLMVPFDPPTTPPSMSLNPPSGCNQHYNQHRTPPHPLPLSFPPKVRKLILQCWEQVGGQAGARTNRRRYVWPRTITRNDVPPPCLACQLRSPCQPPWGPLPECECIRMSVCVDPPWI